MTITGAFVLFAVYWFMLLFIILPLRLQTQQEAGRIVPGTPPSAPVDPRMKRKLFWVTVIAVGLWIPTCLVIWSGLISVSDLDTLGRFRN